ncbi:MAG: hypothetical protein GEU75_00275 [Dehalococcoidia bacterium]|nr:hypothetical protein [Dehalococcoidia bacterium]
MPLSIFGQLETLIADHLYPHRYIITPIAALLLAGAVLLALRLGLHRVLWQHRLATAVVGTPLLIVSLVAGDYFVSPLWERSERQEASPLAAASMPSGASSSAEMVSAATTGPRATHIGMFKGADDFHFGRGDALLIQIDANAHVLRFEDFSVRNGPDLYVYLSLDETGRRVDETLNLGRLKATDGAFNYEIPPGTDLKDVKSVVVWCKQFSTLFAVAPLMAN